MHRKTQDDFIPADISRSSYGAMAAGDFVWNGNALDTEDKYNRAIKVWDRCVTSGIKNSENCENNGEYIFLAIQGQVEPALWNKTKDDPRFVAIQTLKCPIEFINLTKGRCTRAAAGVWAPLALLSNLVELPPIHKVLLEGAMLCLLVTTSAQWSLVLLQHQSWMVCWL